ncbi:MAG TPA: helix-hairpin-helix domain-containing protein [Gaiellaceae bacterium]|nr:helix-hairpin-helix domain-containing protein [Gaiellaceae bacterium]
MQLPDISRRRALAYVVALLAVLTLAGRVAFRSDPEAPAAAPVRLQAAAAPARKVVVHVVGEVGKPGLYTLPDGSRVDDAIARAGGPKSKAALELVNLAAPVADGQQVVVPSRREAAQAAAGGASGSAAPGGVVHLNSATLEELDTLPGIGPVTAQKILDYRTAHGAFGSVDELDAVSGIGPATLAELHDLVGL